jgi:hypothetical protein
MHKFKIRSLITTLFAIGLAGAFLPGRAQTPTQPADPNATAPKTEPATPKKKPKSEEESKGHGMQFHGKITAVNQVEKTITVKGKEKEHVLQITSHSKLSKEGKPATLADAVVGENVAGFAKETAAGKFEAVSIRLNAKAPGQNKPKKSPEATESGQPPKKTP